MRQYFYILFLSLIVDTIGAQNIQLIEVKHDSDYSKDCRNTGNCVSTKYIKNDTLYLIIFLDNNGRDLGSYRDSFKYSNDTLNMILIDTNRVIISTRFDSINNKTDTFYSYNIPVMRQLIGGHDFQKFQYRLVGFKKIPNVFLFDNDKLCDCPTKPIKFMMYKNDTVNMINANGYKHGLWLSFYDSGEINEKKYFDNGRFLGGKTYDKDGKDLHYYSHDEDGISIMHIEIDSIKNK